MNKFYDGFNEYLDGSEATAEIKEKYINEYLDRNIWINLLDEDSFSKIIEFYDSSL